MKVFLIQTPLWGLQPPIALTSLGNYLQERGHDVACFDMNIRLYQRRDKQYAHAFTADQSGLWPDADFARKFLESQRPFIISEFIRPMSAGRPVVGFSINICSVYPSLVLAEWIKQANPDAFIVFGGELFSVEKHWSRMAIESGHVDAVVEGDGEETFSELLQFLDEGRDLSACRGLYLRNSRGDIQFTGARRPIDMDEMAFSDYSLVNYEDYSFDGICDRHDVIFMASRGCIRNCTFCGYRVPWPGFRAMSGDRVYAEIKYQEKKLGKIEMIKFYDLLMNGDLRKLARLCDLLIAAGGRKYLWRDINCVVRPEMSYELCRKMYLAGCRDVTFGLESGSQRVLDLMRKQASPEIAELNLKNMSDAGIRTLGNFMFGFPGETEEDFEQTLSFLDRIHPYLHNCYPSYTFTVIEPASPLAWEKEEIGIAADHRLYWETRDGSNTYPVRLDRYRRFRDKASSLGVAIRDGVETSLEMWLSLCLAEYHEYKNEFAIAAGHYKKYVSQDPYNNNVVNRLAYCESRMSGGLERSVVRGAVGLPR